MACLNVNLFGFSKTEHVTGLLLVILPAEQAKDTACFVSIEPMAVEQNDFPFPINEKKYLPIQTKT